MNATGIQKPVGSGHLATSAVPPVQQVRHHRAFTGHQSHGSSGGTFLSTGLEKRSMACHVRQHLTALVVCSRKNSPHLDRSYS